MTQHSQVWNGTKVNFVSELLRVLMAEADANSHLLPLTNFSFSVQCFQNDRLLIIWSFDLAAFICIGIYLDDLAFTIWSFDLDTFICIDID